MADALLGVVFENLMSLLQNEFSTISGIKSKAEKPSTFLKMLKRNKSQTTLLRYGYNNSKMLFMRSMISLMSVQSSLVNLEDQPLSNQRTSSFAMRSGTG
jgi:hypothetical protein